MAVSKPLLSEFGIHHRLESCARNILCYLLSFLDALSRRVANNKSWFDAYFRANAVSLDRDPSKCDRECRKVQTCAISNIDYAQYAHCVERGDGATVGGRYPHH